MKAINEAIHKNLYVREINYSKVTFITYTIKLLYYSVMWAFGYYNHGYNRINESYSFY